MFNSFDVHVLSKAQCDYDVMVYTYGVSVNEP